MNLNLSFCLGCFMPKSCCCVRNDSLNEWWLFIKNIKNQITLRQAKHNIVKSLTSKKTTEQIKNELWCHFFSTCLSHSLLTCMKFLFFHYLNYWYYLFTFRYFSSIDVWLWRHRKHTFFSHSLSYGFDHFNFKYHIWVRELNSSLITTSREVY